MAFAVQLSVDLTRSLQDRPQAVALLQQVAPQLQRKLSGRTQCTVISQNLPQGIRLSMAISPKVRKSRHSGKMTRSEKNSTSLPTGGLSVVVVQQMQAALVGSVR